MSKGKATPPIQAPPMGVGCFGPFYEIIVILACEYVSVRNHIKYFFLNHAVGRNYYS